jgi:DNA-binding MarR family transcriptional regulator
VADRDRRRREAAVLSALRDLRMELAVLNHRVGSRVELKDLDFDCLDVIAREGPISPTALAGRVGVHAATMTGILNRLEAGGWITRQPAVGDRRGVVVASTPERQREVYGIFGGMNNRMGALCGRYSDAELDTIADFLARSVEAGRASADELG